MTSEFPQSRWVEECMYRMGKIYFEQNRWQECMALFDEFNKKFSKSIYTPGSLLSTGLSYLILGKTEKAKEALGLIWIYYPASNESKEAENYLKENIYKVKNLEDVFKPFELFIRADKFYDAGNFRETSSILAFISKGDFERTFKLTALKKMGEFYEKEKRYLMAIDTYKQLIRELEKERDNKMLPGIYLNLAKACYQINLEKEFNFAAKVLFERFSDSAEIKDFFYILGRFLEDEGRFDESINAFTKILNMDGTPYRACSKSI